MTSLQVLAFAAAGALWGVKVQEKETEKAKDEAKKSKEDAQASKLEPHYAHAGKDLARMYLDTIGQKATVDLRHESTGEAEDLSRQATAVWPCRSGFSGPWRRIAVRRSGSNHPSAIRQHGIEVRFARMIGCL